MNKYFCLLTAALLLTRASSAFAASETDLTVTGIITPAACEPNLANGGIVDYGKKFAKDLNETSHTRLEDRTIQLTVNCNAAAQFAISLRDNRPNTASLIGGVQNFGLGLINGNERLGDYYLVFKNPVADVAVKALWSLNKGETWRVYSEDDPIPRIVWLAFGNDTGGVMTPDYLQTVTVDIVVSTLIAPANRLTLIDEVKMDGSATLQIEYL
ncbi:DUF1120 domain-containing protein [Pseudomonas sp. XS1P51]